MPSAHCFRAFSSVGASVCSSRLSPEAMFLGCRSPCLFSEGAAAVTLTAFCSFGLQDTASYCVNWSSDESSRSKAVMSVPKVTVCTGEPLTSGFFTFILLPSVRTNSPLASARERAKSQSEQ